MPRIAGYGLVTPLGRSSRETWDALLGGRSITDHSSLSAPVRSDLPRVTSLAIEAAEEAILQAGWKQLAEPGITALIVGTSKGPVESWLRSPPPISPASDNPNLMAGRVNFGLAEMASDIVRHLGLTDGPRLTVSAACASGLQALIRGSMMIQSGEASRVLVVAAEASVHPLFLASFQRLGVLPPPGALCRPFDVHRLGFLMSDAAAAICLEASTEPGIYVDRYALGGDATHLTGSKSDGAVLAYLLNKLTSPSDRQNPPATSDNLCYVKLDESRAAGRFDPLDFDLIHAHGTGTKLNDETELKVLEAAFLASTLPAPAAVADSTLGLQSSPPTNRKTPILFSHKGAIGHSLGASGLASVVINCMCHRAGRVPGNVNTTEPESSSAVKISASPVVCDVHRSMAISSGFGGPTAMISLITVAAKPRTAISGFHPFVLLLIVIFAGVLRWHEISTVGYWTDELCSLSSAQGWGLQLYKLPLNQITPPLPVYTRVIDARSIRAVPGAIARDDTHPPVYFLLLRLWEDVFGDSESATRSLSICFSLAAIGLLYLVAKESVGRAAALWTALMMAVASPQIMFSLETRDYMPALAFSLAGTWAFMRLERKPSVANAVWFGLSLLVMMLTHYYCAGIAFALVLHALIRRRGQLPSMVLSAAAGAALVFLLIWGHSFLMEIPNFSSNTQWLFDTGPGRLHRWVLRLALVPGMLFGSNLPEISAALGLAFFWLPWGYIRRPELRPWILWLVCTIGLIAGQDLMNSTTQMTLPRYLIFAAPAVYVLLAAAIRGSWRWLPPAVGVLIALLSLRSAYTPSWKIDLRTPVEKVAYRLQPGDGLVITGPDPVFDGICYAAYKHYLPAMPAATAVLTKPIDPATLDRLRRCPHVWLLWMWTDRPINQILPGYTAPPVDRGHMPYFGDLMRGKVSYVQRATSPYTILQK